LNGILTGIREEIFDLVIMKKGSVLLNFGFGSLNLRAGGSVEFKSINNVSSNDLDKLPF